MSGLSAETLKKVIENETAQLRELLREARSALAFWGVEDALRARIDAVLQQPRL
jgi:hypothetical protein